MSSVPWRNLRTNRDGTPARRDTRAFTLIEVLIVIVLMAILATVAIVPSAGWVEQSRESAAATDVRVLRSAIQRYELDHGGKLPQVILLSLPQLTFSTNAAGTIGTGPLFPYGPYVQDKIPQNPLNGSRLVVATAQAPPANLDNCTGWVYNPNTGQIWAGQKKTPGICP